MKGFSFVHLTSNPANPAEFVVRSSGVILDEILDGALLVRFEAGPRSHNRLVPLAEAMQWTLFENGEALQAFMRELTPKAPAKSAPPVVEGVIVD